MKPTARTLVYYASFIILGFVSASLGPSLPRLAEHTGARLGGIGFLFTARSFGYLTGSFLGGRLYDRMPGHPLLASVLALLGVMMVLIPIMPALWMLTVVLMVLGLGQGCLDVGCNTLLVWEHRGNAGPFLNGLHFCFGVGAFLTPLVMAASNQATGDVLWGYWVLAALMAAPLAPLLSLSSPVHHAGAGGAEDGRPGLIGMFPLAGLLFLYSGAEVGFAGWIFTYAVSRSAGVTMAAYLTSTFWGAFTVGRLLSVPAAGRFDARAVLATDFGLCLASLGVILILPDSSRALLLGAAGFGLGMASIFPTVLSLAASKMRMTGSVTGWFFIAAAAGGMSIPWLVGRLMESLGPRSLIAALTVVMAGASAFLATVSQRVRRSDAR